MAAPPELEDGSWFLLSANEGNHLLRSQDQGRSWEMVGGDPAGDTLLELVEVGGVVVARSQSSLWWTEDQGQSWQKQALPAEIVDMIGGARLVLVGDGIWAGTPEQMSKEAEGVFVRIGAGDVATAADGGIWRALPVWTQVATLPGAVDALGEGEQLFVLDGDRRLFRLGDGWEACGQVEERGIFSMAADGQGGLVVSGADVAPYYSDDACQSWELRDPPESVIYGDEGGASGPNQAYPVLLAAGSRWLVGGWFGLWHSEDQGRQWLDSPLQPPDFVRGLAVAGGRVYKGGYSFGVAYSDDDGRTFSTPNLGLLPTNAQIILPVPESETLHAVVNHRGWTSQDGGVNWVGWATSDALDHIRGWAILEDGTLLVDAKTGVWFTSDEGATIQSDAELNLLLDGEPVVGVASFLGEAVGATSFHCVVTETRLLCRNEGEDSYRLRYQSEGPLCGPATGPDGVWVGGPAGLFRVDSIAGEDVMAPVAPERIFVSTGGIVYLTTAAAELYQQQGADWRRLAQMTAPIAEIVEMAETSLLVGTHDGVWRLGDLSAEQPTVQRWGTWERMDGSSDFLRWFPQKPGAVAVEAADFGAVHPLRPGTELRGWLRGSRLQIRGRSRAGAQVLLRLDGEPVATLAHGGDDGLRVLWSSESLSEGWHLLELVGVEGGLAIDSLDGCTGDSLEACIPEEAKPQVPTPVEDDCGCQRGAGAWLWLGAFGILRRRSAPR